MAPRSATVNVALDGASAALSATTGGLAGTKNSRPAGKPVPTTAPPTTSATPTTPPPATSETPTTSAQPTSSSAKPKPAHGGSLAVQVVDLVNDERGKAGCDPLSTEPHLTTAAQDHSDDMAARNYFSHDTPEGVPFDQRIKQAGYDQPGAENIAMGATSAAQVMDMWMNSPGHRANILNCKLTEIGVGVTTAGWYWTQDFGF